MSLSLEGVRSIKDPDNTKDSPIYEEHIRQFLKSEGFQLGRKCYHRAWNVYRSKPGCASYTHEYTMNICPNYIHIKEEFRSYRTANKTIKFENDFVSAYNESLDILKKWNSI